MFTVTDNGRRLPISLAERIGKIQIYIKAILYSIINKIGTISIFKHCIACNTFTMRSDQTNLFIIKKIRKTKLNLLYIDCGAIDNIYFRKVINYRKYDKNSHTSVFINPVCSNNTKLPAIIAIRFRYLTEILTGPGYNQCASILWLK